MIMSKTKVLVAFLILVSMPGVMFGVTMAIRALTKENDAVLICQPVYYPFSNVVINNNRKLVVNELVLNNGRYEIDFDDFEEKIIKENVKVFLFCSPHNPVARVWEKEELEKIAEILSKYTKEEITAKSTLVNDLGLSSFDIVSIVTAFEDEFDIEISDRDIRTLVSVADIMDYIENN